MIYKFFKSLFPQNDKRAGTPAPDLQFRYAGFLRRFAPRNDGRKNHRRGNGNKQVCVLPRALLDFCATTAQALFTLKTRRTMAQTTIPCECLLGGAPMARFFTVSLFIAMI